MSDFEKNETSEENTNIENTNDNTEIKDDDITIIDCEKEDDLSDSEPVDETANMAKDADKFDWKKEALSWVKMIVVAMLIAFVVTRFIIINANVPTESMENTIPKESRILGLRLSYLFSEPERGDVVVFEFQFKEDTNYVKRIVGLPGETVYVKNGTIEIYKDGEYVETLSEPYVKEDWNTGKVYTFEVPEGKYLVLGDNRNNSADARYWYDNVYMQYNQEFGLQCDYEDIFVDEDAILGKVYMTYWPSFKWIS